MFSIGGYKLTKKKETEDGYTVTLAKGRKNLAEVEFTHEGVMDNIRFEVKEDSNYLDFVVKDLNNLFYHLKPVLHQDGEYLYYLSTPHNAMLGFTLLLTDLEKIVDEYNNLMQSYDKVSFYALIQTGQSIFDQVDQDKPKQVSHMFISATSHEKALEGVMDYINTVLKDEGKLRALAVLYGKMDWNLSFEDYAELYTP